MSDIGKTADIMMGGTAKHFNEGLYYGKESIVEEIRTRGQEEVDKSKGSTVLNTIKDKELLEKVNEILEQSNFDRHNASDCQKAIRLAKKELKTRFHVELAPEMGKDLTEIADKMGLTLSAVVKLMLMENWMKYQVNGFDYIYLGVADKPSGISAYPEYK